MPVAAPNAPSWENAFLDKYMAATRSRSRSTSTSTSTSAASSPPKPLLTTMAETSHTPADPHAAAALAKPS